MDLGRVVIIYPLMLAVIKWINNEIIIAAGIFYFWIYIYVKSHFCRTYRKEKARYLNRNIGYDFFPAFLLVAINLCCFEQRNIGLVSAFYQAALLTGGAIWEEILCRNLVFTALLKRTSVHKALWIESIFFGSLHFFNAGMHMDYVYTVVQICVAIGVGLWLSVVAIKNGNIFWSIVSHVCINLSSVFLENDSLYEINTFQSAVLLLSAIFYVVISWRYIVNKGNMRNGEYES